MSTDLQLSRGTSALMPSTTLGRSVSRQVTRNMIDDPSPMCSVQHPCQPDTVFPMVVVLTGLSAAAVYWLPVPALAAGVGYAVLGVLFDPSRAGRYAEAAVGCVALGLLLWIKALRARQAQVAERASRGAPAPVWPSPGRQRKISGFASTPAVVRAVGALGLVLLVASVGAYLHQTSAERAHVARALGAHARVVTYTDDDYRQVFQIESGTRTGDRVAIEVTDDLTRGSVWPILVDPADPTWARLMSEPKGFTSWFGWGLLGGAVAFWCVGHELGRVRAGTQRTAAAAHRVRLTRSGAAELTLATGGPPLAWVRLAGTGDTPRAGAPQPALVRGRVADGSWVSIQTETGVLPVVAPLRTNPGWRHVGVRAAPLDTGVAAGWDRVRKRGPALGRVILLVLGCFLAYLAVNQAGPAWAAAQGRGVPGAVTVTREDCGGRGGCHYSGDFRSTDGRYTFRDVELVGAKGPLGTDVPALYEGDGDHPDAVYGPGWGGLVESCYLLGAALLAAGEPLLRLLARAIGRWRPATGRHAARD